MPTASGRTPPRAAHQRCTSAISAAAPCPEATRLGTGDSGLRDRKSRVQLAELILHALHVLPEDRRVVDEPRVAVGAAEPHDADRPAVAVRLGLERHARAGGSCLLGHPALAHVRQGTGETTAPSVRRNRATAVAVDVPVPLGEEPPSPAALESSDEATDARLGRGPNSEMPGLRVIADTHDVSFERVRLHATARGS